MEDQQPKNANEQQHRGFQRCRSLLEQLFNIQVITTPQMQTIRNTSFARGVEGGRAKGTCRALLSVRARENTYVSYSTQLVLKTSSNELPRSALRQSLLLFPLLGNCEGVYWCLGSFLAIQKLEEQLWSLKLQSVLKYKTL